MASNSISVPAYNAPMEPVYREKSKEEILHEMNRGFVKSTDRLKDKSIELAIRVAEAGDFMEYAVNHIRRDWLEWQDQADKALLATRQTRQALDFETKHILACCQDVRTFFLGDKHQEEVSRLKEFVELCVRLRELKADGTLDAVSDTILKLHERDQ